MNYKSFFLTVDKKLEWTNKSFVSDQAAIRDARLKLREGETVKIYSDTRVVWDSEEEHRAGAEEIRQLELERELAKVLAQADALIASQKQILARGPQKMNIDYNDPEALRARIMELEAALVYLKNFLPAPLKKQAEEVLFGPSSKHQ